MRMDKDTEELIKDGVETFHDIAQMTQYRIKYAQNRDSEAKEKMYKYAVLAGLGILCLLMAGIAGLRESTKSY